MEQIDVSGRPFYSLHAGKTRHVFIKDVRPPMKSGKRSAEDEDVREIELVKRPEEPAAGQIQSRSGNRFESLADHASDGQLHL